MVPTWYVLVFLVKRGPIRVGHPHTLYARHALESVALEKSKNCQKGKVQRIFSIKGVLMKRVWQK